MSVFYGDFTMWGRQGAVATNVMWESFWYCNTIIIVLKCDFFLCDWVITEHELFNVCTNDV